MKSGTVVAFVLLTAVLVLAGCGTAPVEPSTPTATSRPKYLPTLGVTYSTPLPSDTPRPTRTYAPSPTVENSPFINACGGFYSSSPNKMWAFCEHGIEAWVVGKNSSLWKYSFANLMGENYVGSLSAEYWARDGQYVYFSPNAIVDGGYGPYQITQALLRMNLLDGKTTIVVPPRTTEPIHPYYEFSFSPTGRRLAYNNAFPLRVEVMDLATSDVKIIRQFETGCYYVGGFAWSSDGTKLSFNVLGNETCPDQKRYINLVDNSDIAIGTHSDPLVVETEPDQFTNPCEDLSEPSLSPDKRWAYFICEDPLYTVHVVNQDNTKHWQLQLSEFIPNENFILMPYRWSADGQYEYFRGGTCAGDEDFFVNEYSSLVIRLNLFTGEKVRILENGCFRTVFNPTDKYLVYFPLHDKTLTVRDLKTNEESLFSIDQFNLVSDFLWSPDGNRLIFVGTNAITEPSYNYHFHYTIMMLDLQTATVSPLASNLESSPNWTQWNESNKILFFLLTHENQSTVRRDYSLDLTNNQITPFEP